MNCNKKDKCQGSRPCTEGIYKGIWENRYLYKRNKKIKKKRETGCRINVRNGFSDI